MLPGNYKIDAAPAPVFKGVLSGESLLVPAYGAEFNSGVDGRKLRDAVAGPSGQTQNIGNLFKR